MYIIIIIVSSPLEERKSRDAPVSMQSFGREDKSRRSLSSPLEERTSRDAPVFMQSFGREDKSL